MKEAFQDSKIDTLTKTRQGGSTSRRRDSDPRQSLLQVTITYRAGMEA